MGITCNTSGKENEVMVCLRLSYLPQLLPRAPLIASWSVLPPASAAFLAAFYTFMLPSVEGKKIQQQQKKDQT